MCFFDTERFTCGDWRWSHFRSHCNKEYRIGETCGMKLVWQNNDIPRKCQKCDTLDTKLRKREKICERIARWQAERSNPASIQKGIEEIMQLDEQIKRLSADLTMARASIGNASSRRRA